MCLALPYKVISRDKNKIQLDFFGKKRTVKESLIKIKPGDFVLVQKGVVVKKVPKKQAKEILKLISKK
ncbi:MAG: HypC/HybG/HupF family hydrogenase formation chaperone [Candidatus Pacebacteria bacterium]|nr:HypC/HybG/HupF family hydrogenase formation chaperone [Candidatus Paceibacterota bacterium]